MQVYQGEEVEEDMCIEDLIFPNLIRPGIAQRCTFCLLKRGCLVAFTSLKQYAKHVVYNHEGYSIYVFDEDISRFREELLELRRKQLRLQFRQP